MRLDQLPLLFTSAIEGPLPTGLEGYVIIQTARRDPVLAFANDQGIWTPHEANPIPPDLILRYMPFPDIREAHPESLGQIGRLAEFILTHVPCDPALSGGAVDAAIRIIGALQAGLATMRTALVEAEESTIDPDTGYRRCCPTLSHSSGAHASGCLIGDALRNSCTPTP